MKKSGNKRGKKQIKIIIVILVMIALIAIFAQDRGDSKKLNEFQVTACNSADKGGTCDTKLEGLGLVTKEECCSSLGRCC